MRVDYFRNTQKHTLFATTLPEGETSGLDCSTELTFFKIPEWDLDRDNPGLSTEACDELLKFGGVGVSIRGALQQRDKVRARVCQLKHNGWKTTSSSTILAGT